MGRKLVFKYDGEPLAFEMNKVDRSRLYGSKSLRVLDDSGKECELATLADDGKTLIGKGGTGIGYVTADGNWTHKDNLQAVNVEGESIVPVPSSFAAPIELEHQVTVDDYLNHNIRLVYKLTTEVAYENLRQALNDGAIFKFDYSYRGGLEADAGFLLMNDAGEVFFLVGDETDVEFIGLQQTAAVTPVDEATTTGDLMDFDMI